MNVDKIILKAFLGTIGAISALFVFMLVALVGIYPETMQEITYDLGMDSPCIWFAERTYNRHGKIEDIAFAMEVAIADGNHKKVISCGKKVIADDEFLAHCERKTQEIFKSIEGKENEEELRKILGEYDEYVYGQVCVSQYELGQKSSAVKNAGDWTGNAFPKNNALVRLLVEARKDKDAQTVSLLVEKMESITVPQGDQTYYDEILAYAKSPFTGETENA